MRVILMALICVFSVFSVSAQKQVDSKPKQQVIWKTYTDTKEKVSIKYPATWEKKDAPTTVFQFMSPYLQRGQRFRENVVLTKGEAQDLYLVEYLMDARNKMPQELTGFKELKSQYVKIGGRECCRMVYEFTHGDLVLKDVLYIFINKGKAYSLNFSALRETFDKFYPTFDKMANTFKIK